MSITLPSEETVFQYYIQLFQAQNSTWDLSDKSFFGLLARAMAQGTMLLMDSVYDADSDSVPAYAQDSDGTQLSRCSSAALDAWAITYGLPSLVAGVYGRKGAQGSSGGAGVPTCSIAGTLISAGDQLTDSTGQVTVRVVADVTTDGPPNTLAVALESVTTGAAANLPIGSVLTFTAPPVGVSASLTLTSALSGGSDRESDGALLARILFRLQNPPRGGAASDYKFWAESSTDATQNNKSNNIFRAFVFPLRSGLGSVDVMPLYSGTGIAKKPASTVLAAVQAYLDSVRPVTATVNVIEAYMPAALALRIRVRVTPATKYAYDWDDSGTATLVNAYAAGPPAVITLAAPIPALKAVVDAGGQPRIQLIVTTAGPPAAKVTPYQVRVVAYTVGAPDTITLETPLPTGFVAPSVNDQIYAGGPVVDVAAAAVLSMMDGLGPSRQSGYADVYDVWEYKVSLSRICDVVMEVRDTDGTRMVSVIPNLGTTGIQIAVGAGAFAAVDYEPRDVLGDCEVPFLRRGGIEIVRAG